MTTKKSEDVMTPERYWTEIMGMSEPRLSGFSAFEHFKAGWQARGEHCPDVQATIDALKFANAILSGMAHTMLPIHVRELDGSITTERPVSPAGQAYQRTQEALERWGKK